MSQVCKHERLHFGSGGYYVICSLCGCYWIAAKDTETHAMVKDPGRSIARLSDDDDVRVTLPPRRPVTPPAFPAVEVPTS